MALQVPSNTFAPVAQTSLSSTPPAVTGRIVATPTSKQVDTVKLSVGAHIHLLKSQGQSAKQIAANLGVSTADVSAYFSTAGTAKQTAATLPPAHVDAHTATTSDASAGAVRVAASVAASGK